MRMLLAIVARLSSVHATGTCGLRLTVDEPCANGYGSQPQEQSYQINQFYERRGTTASSAPYYCGADRDSMCIFWDQSCGGAQEASWLVGCQPPDESLTEALQGGDGSCCNSVNVLSDTKTGPPLGRVRWDFQWCGDQYASGSTFITITEVSCGQSDTGSGPSETCSDLTTEAECWPAQRDQGCWWENGRCEYVVPAEYDLQTTYSCTTQDSPICAGYVQACYEVACGECAACGAGNDGTSPSNDGTSPFMAILYIPLTLMVIPLCIWKIRMKKRAAERREERARQAAMAQSSIAMQPMGQQPVIQAYAEPQPMAVTCPPGLGPGDSLMVNMGGQQVTVQVPEGITPGGMFLVQPPPQQVVAVATAVPV